MHLTIDEPAEYGRQRDGSYQPSPDEIAKQCELIRKGWSGRMHYTRQATMPGAPAHLEQEQARPAWLPHVVHVDAELAAMLNLSGR